MSLKYEQAKVQYWRERESRESAFAQTPEGKRQLEDGSFYNKQAEREAAKVYIKSNPGPVHLGHMSNQTFHQGLPLSAHLNEPRRK